MATLLIEADSLEDARAQVESRIPDGERVLSEEIIDDGRPHTVTGVAETSEAATAQAQSFMPPDAVVLSEKNVASSHVSTVTVEAFDESGAFTAAESMARHIAGSVVVIGVTQLTPGAKGFLGIGRKPARQGFAKVLGGV
jgi:hypothetical protein